MVSEKYLFESAVTEMRIDTSRLKGLRFLVDLYTPIMESYRELMRDKNHSYLHDTIREMQHEVMIYQNICKMFFESGGTHGKA